MGPVAGLNDGPKIQLFRQRLSKESVKAYATMPKGSLGNIKVSIKAPAEQCLGRTAKT